MKEDSYDSPKFQVEPQQKSKKKLTKKPTGEYQKLPPKLDSPQVHGGNHQTQKYQSLRYIGPSGLFGDQNSKASNIYSLKNLDPIIENEVTKSPQKGQQQINEGKKQNFDGNVTYNQLTEEKEKNKQIYQIPITLQKQSSKKQSDPVKKQCPNRKCVFNVTIIVVLLTLISVLLGLYLSRKPEVVNVSQPYIIKYSGAWEQIERFFFNISGLTYTGRVDEGRGAASIVHISSTYTPPSSPRLLQDTVIDFFAYTPRVGSSGDGENIYRYYGYIDLFAPSQGVTVRGLNPENRVYYIDYETMLEYASKPHTAASRLLSEGSNRILTATTQDYFAEVIAQEIASLEGVALDRVIVKKEEVWVGTLNPNSKDYTISTVAPQTIAADSNQTAAEKKKTAQSYYDSVLKVAIEEKKNHLQDYGATVANYFVFSFDRYVDLYETYEQTTTLGSDDDDEVEDTTDETNSTNTTVRLHPRPPIIITKVYEAVYGNRPRRLKEGKTVARTTYDSMLACIDYNETTRACSIDEWNNAESSSKISEESRARQGSFASRTRFRVSIKPLPANEVVQEPYQKYDPEEMYNHEQDNATPMKVQNYSPQSQNPVASPP